MKSIKIVLRFPPRLVDQPVISRAVRQYDLEFNILKAFVAPSEEGLMVLEISGKNGACEQAMAFLSDAGVRIELLSQDVVRNEDRCTHCGTCIPACACGALAIEPKTMRVRFNDEKCIACEHCVPACPVRAIDVRF